MMLTFFRFLHTLEFQLTNFKIGGPTFFAVHSSNNLDDLYVAHATCTSSREFTNTGLYLARRSH